MDITLQLNNLKDLEKENVKIDVLQFQKMILLYNSLEDGWTLSKNNNCYIFKKPHFNKQEVFENDYLMKFMKSNLDVTKLFN